MSQQLSFRIQALTHLNYHSEHHNEVLARFATNWGNLDETALLRALNEGSRSEQLISMHILAFGHQQVAKEAIRRLTSDPNIEVRWHAIECLARLGDREGINSLTLLLREKLPPADTYIDEATRPNAVEDLRVGAIRLLGIVGTRDHASPLRSALERYIQIEQGFSWNSVDAAQTADGQQHEEGAVLNACVRIHSCQDSAVFALGQLAAVGALTGLNLEGVRDLWGNIDGVARLNMWRVHLSLAYHIQQSSIDALPLSEEALSALLIELRTLMEHIFGTSPRESEQLVARYSIVELLPTLNRLQWERGTITFNSN